MKHTLDTKPGLLLVDDDEDMLFLMSRKLTKEGYKVEVSHNANGLDEIINAVHPDIILLDIQMNGVNGGDICKKLKTKDETKNIPILLISANHNVNEIAAWCGADGYFSKPVDPVLLTEKIKTLIH